MSSNSASSDKFNLSLTTFLVGVPILVGASCYYVYYYRNQSSSDSHGKSSSSSSSSNNKASEKAQVKKLSPLEQVRQLKQTGNKHFSRKNYDLAIESYTKAIELAQSIQDEPIDPDDIAIFYQNRAASKEAQGNYEDVVSDCSEAIKLKKDYTKAYFRRAKAHQKLEQYDEAMVDIFAVNLLEKFQNQNSMEMMEDIVKRSSKVKAAKAMETHKFRWPSNLLVKNYFASFPSDPMLDKIEGDYIENSVQLQPLLDEANLAANENDPLSMLVRGSCFSLMGDYKNANDTLDRLIELDDHVEGSSPRMKAIALMKKSALIISESNLDSNMDNIKTAIDLLEKAKSLDPNIPDVYLHLGQLMTMLERAEEGLEYLNKALELHPKYYPSLAQKLYLEYKTHRGRFAKLNGNQVLEKFREAVEENNNALELLQVYAQVLSEATYLEKADKVLLDMIKKDPKHTTAKISRALLQIQIKNDPTEAATLIREALKEDPDNLYAYEILGSIEGQLGRSDEAIKIFEQALKYAQSEAEYARIYGLLDSARTQKTVVDRLGSPM